MAKIHIERAYIEPENEEQDNFAILIHIKRDVEHIYAGKVELDRPIKWLHVENAENGDLLINNSAGMEANKWDYLTKEIIGDISGKPE
jgi:hypothetical protein